MTAVFDVKRMGHDDWAVWRVPVLADGRKGKRRRLIGRYTGLAAAFAAARDLPAPGRPG